MRTAKELERLFTEEGGAIELTDKTWISDYGHRYQLFSEDLDDGYTPIRELTVEEVNTLLFLAGKGIN